MKINKKIIFLILGIGISINIMCMENPKIGPLVRRYRPVYEMDSAEGAMASWAQQFISRLSDNERAALIYEAYIQPSNENANASWGRGALSFASAATRIAADTTVDWAKWLLVEKPTQVISGVTGAISSYVTPAFQYAASFVRTPLKRLDDYLSTNKNAYINQRDNDVWFNDVIRLALEDFNDPDVKQYLTEKQRTYPSFQIDLIVDKILPVMTESANDNRITPLARDEVTRWVLKRWMQPAQQPVPLTPLQQLAIQKDIQWQEEQKQRAQQQQQPDWFGWGQQQPQQQPVQQPQQQSMQQSQAPQQQKAGQKLITPQQKKSPSSQAPRKIFAPTKK